MNTEKQDTFHMQFVKRGIRLLDSTINLMVLLLFLGCIFFGIYAIWDSEQVYQEAAAVGYEQYKPEDKDLRSFDELKQINPDVFGWLTVYGTNIDYPLVQGADNEIYVNTSVTKEAALSGSLFLDYRNKQDFSDFNSIIYGHHMMKQVMFGEIGEFKDEAYFEDHRYGNLSYEGKNQGIEFILFLEADAYDRNIYTPGITGDENYQQYLAYLLAEALHIRGDKKEIMFNTERLVLLSTCDSRVTNGRHILVGRVSNKTYKDPFQNTEGIGGKFDRSEVDGYLMWIGIGIAILLLLAALSAKNMRKKNGEKRREERK